MTTLEVLKVELGIFVAASVACEKEYPRSGRRICARTTRGIDIERQLTTGGTRSSDVMNLIGIAEARGDENTSVRHEVLEVGTASCEPTIERLECPSGVRRDALEHQIATDLSYRRLCVSRAGGQHQDCGEQRQGD